MDVTTELKTVGLKATMPRVKVLETFHSHERRHLTAEDVFKRLAESGSDIGLGTVYRVLAQLAEVGTKPPPMPNSPAMKPASRADASIASSGGPN